MEAVSMCVQTVNRPCPCGCGNEVLGRKNKRYASSSCRSRRWNNKRAEIQKEAITMAINFLTGFGYEVTKKGRV